MSAPGRQVTCPNCANPTTDAIRYGYDTVHRDDPNPPRGCLRSDGDADRVCPACGHEWISIPPIYCPDCAGPLNRAGTTTVECRQCGYQHSAGIYLAWQPGADPDELVRRILEIRDQTEPDVQLLDTSNADQDDEDRDPDGYTREERLDVLQQNHDEGLVLIDDAWMVLEDAVAEVGHEQVQRLRADMAAHLQQAWGELDLNS
jgi:hypothetical protein